MDSLIGGDYSDGADRADVAVYKELHRVGAHLVTCCTHWTGAYRTMVCTGYRTHIAKQMNRSKA